LGVILKCISVNSIHFSNIASKACFATVCFVYPLNMFHGDNFQISSMVTILIKQLSIIWWEVYLHHVYYSLMIGISNTKHKSRHRHVLVNNCWCHCRFAQRCLLADMVLP